MSNHAFKCTSCGEIFSHEMAADDDVALCKWCANEMPDEILDPVTGEWVLRGTEGTEEILEATKEGILEAFLDMEEVNLTFGCFICGEKIDHAVPYPTSRHPNVKKYGATSSTLCVCLDCWEEMKFNVYEWEGRRHNRQYGKGGG